MKKILLALLLSSTTLGYAQRGFSIEETVSGPSKYPPSNLSGLKWTKNEDIFTYQDDNRQNILSRNSKYNWDVTHLSSLSDLQSAVKNIIHDDELELKFFPYQYDWTKSNTITFSIPTTLWVYKIDFDPISKKAHLINKTDANTRNLEYTTNDNQTAYLTGNNELVSADGHTPLNGRITYPPNFDPINKYPIMVYLYGDLMHN